MATERLTVVRVPGTGAEDVLIGPKGHVWTGTEDGSIFRLTPDGHLVERVTTTGGRPLGLELLGDGRILVCDADRGLLAVDPASGRVELLTSAVDGLPMRFCNNAAVAADGRIFFTDSSAHYSVHEWKHDLVEATRTGRLLVRHTDGSVETLLTGLEFANGVALAADESFVAVAETGARTVVRRWLTGARAGTRDYLAQDLPGYPDNISRGTDGLIWVAIASPTDPVVERLKTGPMVLRRGAPARTSKPQFRLDAAAALIADEPAPRDDVALVRFAVTRLGKDVLDLESAVVVLGDQRILDDVTWRLAPGERVGVVGVNGAGKSTLVKALLGQVPLTSGRRRQGKTVVTAYLSQDVRELVPLEGLRVIEAVTAVRAVTRLGDKEVTASQLATRLGFTGSRQQTRVGDLSGGERRRLQLLRLLMAEPNVIVLDEPTNDLDIETLTSLEDILDGWAGTLVVISHDRYLIERVTDHQVALLPRGSGRPGGVVRDLPGGIDEYLALRARLEAAESARRAGDEPAGRADPAGPSAAEVREARKELARIERRLAALEVAESRAHDEMAANPTDHSRMTNLHLQVLEIQRERAELEDAWLAAADAVG